MNDFVDYPRRIAAARDRSERAAVLVEWILAVFSAYYTESRHIPALAKEAFEARDHATSLALSKRRIALYSVGIENLGPRLLEAIPDISSDDALWCEVERLYLPLIEDRYGTDPGDRIAVTMST